MFERNSRYAKRVPYAVTDRRGRTVLVVPAAPDPEDALAGFHLRKQGQRLDHLAQLYLGDPTAFWRIAEIGDAMHPDAIAEADEIAVPVRR